MSYNYFLFIKILDKDGKKGKVELLNRFRKGENIKRSQVNLALIKRDKYENS